MNLDLGIDLAATWLGTFAVHSTLALGITFLVSRLAGTRAIGLQEAALRFSLWGALISASLQCAVFGSPWANALVEVPAAFEFLGAPAASTMLQAPPPVEPVSAPLTVWRWQQWVVVGAALGAAAGGLWLAIVFWRLRSLLHSRRPETDARVLTLAAAAAQAAGLRQSPHVSRCDRVATPIAFGLVRPEICLPANVDQLDESSLRAMLAHEVAHLRAADPAWMWCAASLQALFPWQLLLFPVRLRWARLVELRCDAAAARHAGATAVARCLLDVASWLQPREQAPLVALGMASRPSALRERVDAALRGEPVAAPSLRLAFTGACAVLSALTFAAPGAAPTAGSRDVVAEAELALVNPADAAAPRAMNDLFHALADERQRLTAEAALLQERLQGRRLSPELEQLHAALARRLSDLERLHERLEAHVRRSATESR